MFRVRTSRTSERSGVLAVKGLRGRGGRNRGRVAQSAAMGYRSQAEDLFGILWVRKRLLKEDSSVQSTGGVPRWAYDETNKGRLGNASNLSRRRLLTTSAGLVGSAAAGRALADTLADVPPREVGAPLSGHSDRSKYVRISRIPEAGPGVRHVDLSDAINSKTPLNKLVGAITPSDLHYERSHSGVPDFDPAKQRLGEESAGAHG
jgi:hypothetical protein